MKVTAAAPEGEEGIKGIEQMAVDEDERRPRSSTPKKMDGDADVTELEIGDEGKPSTDVTEEMMVINSSDSEGDETSKQPNDTSRSVATATAGSPNSAQASDDLTSSIDVLLISSSEAGATSERCSRTPSSPSMVSGTPTEVVRTAMETQHRMRSISNARQTHGTHTMSISPNRNPVLGSGKRRFRSRRRESHSNACAHAIQGRLWINGCGWTVQSRVYRRAPLQDRWRGFGCN